MDDELEGVDLGDLPEIFDRVAEEDAGTREAADHAQPLRPEYDGFCAHRFAVINHGMRRLRCRECRADLDPFEFLWRLSQDTERWVSARRAAEARARKAEERLQGVLREERNAKARLRRLKGK